MFSQKKEAGRIKTPDLISLRATDNLQEHWTKATKLALLDRIKELSEFVEEVAVGRHDDLCPLNHPAYRDKWCNCCEAKKLVKI